MSIVADLQLSARSLARRPAWTLTVAATLAIGLGGAIVVGGIAYGVLLRPLPYPESERLVRIFEVDERGHRMNLADPNLTDLAAIDGAFAALAEAPASAMQAVAGEEPLRPTVALVGAAFFDVIGVEPARGRRFTADEHAEGGAPVAIVGERFWRLHFGASEDLDAAKLSIAGTPVRVVGITAAAFDFPASAEIWVPRELRPRLPSRTAHNNPVFARLAPGVSLEAVRARARTLADRLAAEHAGRIDLVDFAVVPLLDTIVVNARPAVLIELAAATFLLLAAVVNAGSLMLARLEVRRRDLATRVALGAGTRHLGRLLFAETLIVTVIGGLAGYALAGLSIDMLKRFAPQALPRIDGVRLDGVVAAGALGIALMTALALALAAARRALRWNVERELREGVGSIVSGRRRWLRGLPVAIQSAAAIVLLAGAALFSASLLRLTSVDPGFRATGVTVLEFHPGPVGDEDSIARRAGRLEEFASELSALPGVRSAGLVSALPIADTAANGTFIELPGPELVVPFDFEMTMRSAKTTGNALYVAASEGYFRTLGIRLLEGRLFEPADTRDRQHVALVSASLARATWPGESALGRYLEFGNMDGDVRPLLVVGVVDDVHQRGLALGPQPGIYVAARQRPTRWAWSTVIAGGSALAGMASHDPSRVRLLAIARRLFPDAAASVGDLESMVAASVADRRIVLVVVAVFALATIGLAATGIFGAVSFAVATRRREYAVRLALGADAPSVARGAFFGGLLPAAAGVVAGLLVALAAGRLLASMLYGIEPQHPPSLAVAVLIVALFGALAAWLPSRRAARIAPAAVLRSE